MAKRFAITFFIVVGILLASTIVFFMVLLLAPGLSLFGIKYIASGTHVVSESCYIDEKITGFSGSIKLEVADIPVQVVFSQNYTYQVVYYDNYNGLTNSKIDDPSIEFSKESDGTAVIKIDSFKKFIYENGNSNRYIKLLIPSTEVGANKQWKTDLTILARNSKVSFRDEVNDNYDPCFKNIKIETSGKVTSSTSVMAQNYSLKTINSIKISDDINSNINATNYILESTGGKIIVDRDVTGDITATTKNARIKILSCENFTANSGYGDICSTRDDVGIIIRGIANINTTAGAVEIDSILGDKDKSTITTKTGNIRIKEAHDIDLTTTRGSVRADSVHNANITTSSGSVVVVNATESITTSSKRGKITLGGEDATVKNPTVQAIYGKVYVENASGKANIQSEKSAVTFINKDAGNIKIVSGKDLTANKLSGAVNIQVGGDAIINFDTFTTNSTITGVGKNSNITINLLKNTGTTFSYNLEGNDATLFEYNSDDIENHYQIGKSTSLTSPAELKGQPLLKAITTGKLVVYYKKTN